MAAFDWQVTTKRDQNGYDFLLCKWCGCEVAWQTAKSGKRYLAQPTPISNEDGRQIKTIYPAHRCQATEEQRTAIVEAEAQQNAAALEAGEIVKGQKVTITRGRKYPIGTSGTITWVADREDAYGTIKARIATDDGDVIFVNIKNLEVATWASK